MTSAGITRVGCATTANKRDGAGHRPSTAEALVLMKRSPDLRDALTQLSGALNGAFPNGLGSAGATLQMAKKYADVLLFNIECEINQYEPDGG